MNFFKDNMLYEPQYIDDAVLKTWHYTEISQKQNNVLCHNFQ